MAFHHVLIPLDGSELSQRVLAPLRSLLGAEGVSSVTLLRVLDDGADEAAANAQLEPLVSRLSAGGVEATHRVVEGDPSEEILRAADELGVDLVAMTTHGRSGLKRILRGSVAERVLRRCPRPLLLWNPTVLNTGEQRHEGFRRILVPHDGSELADRILDPAAALARLFDSAIVLFKVENFATDGGRGKLRTVEEVAASLLPIQERLEAAGVRDVQVRAAIGGEADSILEALETQEIDLLAMTTHGASGASRWWFGSVAEALVRTASCPLFVLRVGSSGS